VEIVRVNGEAVVDLAARWTPGMVARRAGAVLGALLPSGGRAARDGYELTLR
jgi:hypothetical protein